MTTGLNYWGPMFPDAAHVGPCYFGGDFPDCAMDPTVVQPVGPPTVATLALSLEDGLRVRYSFTSPLFTAWSGLETRQSNLTLPKQALQGVAYLAGNNVTTIRGVLVRYAAAAKAFLLGLPHEGLDLSASSSGATVFVQSTALIDWAVPGTRVLVVEGDYSASIVGTVQSTTSNSFVLDVSPGSVGAFGGYIMPAVPVYLDAQQGFDRYPKPGSVEMWKLAARQIMFGYESGANVSAFAKLSTVTSGYLTNAIAVCGTPGTIGNGVSLTLVANGSGSGSWTLAGQAFTFHFQTLVTRLSDLLSALASIGLIRLVGAMPIPFATMLRAGVDEFTATLAGGTDKNWGTMGAGATITTYQSLAVWDRGIALAGGTTADAMQSMVELVDLGGAVTQVGVAAQPDWARQVVYEKDGDANRQWLKAFLYAVRGRQKSWWYPTYRADLTPVQLAPGTLKINGTVGDFFAWWPTKRSYLMLRDSTGSVQYLQITAAVDNGDGTYSLSITSSNVAYNSGGGGVTLSAAQISLVSWMDLCRFESNDFDVTFTGPKFSFQSQARAVPQ
jgi:hypothetical protein